MAGSFVSAYVRPEGAYVTSSDLTTVGVWLESDDWEFARADEAGVVGAVVMRHLKKTPRVVRHPARNEFSTLRSEAIRPLLALAGVRSWTAFIGKATLVTVSNADVITVTPMRRDGRGFSPSSAASEELSDPDVVALGQAVLRAADVLTGDDGN